MTKYSRLIVFFVPPKKIVNGGILSIFSICKVSRQFKRIHGSKVVLATYPGKKSYGKNDLFSNDEIVYSFKEVVKWGAPKSLLLHVPEYASLEIFNGLKRYSEYIKNVDELSINIMTQNILLMQKPVEVANWFLLTPNVTQTTAHNKYTSQELADSYFLPTKHLSTFVDSAQYEWTSFEKKQNIIAISPDVTNQRNAIINKIKKQLPEYKIIIIKNMRYEQYKKLISSAKFTITFGEGFDGYYVEGFFTGGITFAVYNDEFFPDRDFAKFENTYSNYIEMKRLLVKNIIKLSKDKKLYEKIVTQNLSKIKELYNFKRYTHNVEQFYMHHFTYLPGGDSPQRLIAKVLSNRNKTLVKKDKELAEKEMMIAELKKQVARKSAIIRIKNSQMGGIIDSRTYKVAKSMQKITKPLKKRH